LLFKFSFEIDYFKGENKKYFISQKPNIATMPNIGTKRVWACDQTSFKTADHEQHFYPIQR